MPFDVAGYSRHFYEFADMHAYYLLDAALPRFYALDNDGVARRAAFTRFYGMP